MAKRDIWKTLFLTIWLYSLMGWLYIVLNSEIHPRTLGLQLTHFALWPHEDTFGEICFLVSFISFFSWQLLRLPQKRK